MRLRINPSLKFLLAILGLQFFLAAITALGQGGDPVKVDAQSEQLIKGAQGCFMALAGHPVRFTPRQRSGARCQFSGQPGVTGEFQGDWLKGCRVEGFFVYCQ